MASTHCENISTPERLKKKKPFSITPLSYQFCIKHGKVRLVHFETICRYDIKFLAEMVYFGFESVANILWIQEKVLVASILPTFIPYKVFKTLLIYHQGHYIIIWRLFAQWLQRSNFFLIRICLTCRKTRK